MEEIICAGRVENFAQFIQALHFPEGALFLAEEFPRQVIRKPEERKRLMRFDFLIKVTDEERQRYTSGRIFTKDAELRWEKKNGNIYNVVYLDPSIELEGMHINRKESIVPELYEQQRTCYYMFGKRLDEKQLGRMEIPPADAPFASRLYAEARIPRLLHYPWSQQPTGKEEWVQLAVLEYRDKATAQVTFYRFQDVIPAE
jgi:hypothetical protein